MSLNVPLLLEYMDHAAAKIGGIWRRPIGLAGLLILTARVPVSAPPGIAERVPAVGVREPISG